MLSFTQALVGGRVQVTPAHGSLTQTPSLHWCAQVVWREGYEQVPAAQVPTASKTLSTFDATQVAAGADVQLTPAQTLPLHTPLLHPSGQSTTDESYEQVPSLQVPFD